MASHITISPWRICRLLLLSFIALAAAEQSTEADENDPGLNTFVTVQLTGPRTISTSPANLQQRPDIRAPKWNVTVYHEDRLAPGHWFVGPYRILDDDTRGKGWVGAHIYDGNGDLIWSGFDMFSKGNIEDFRVSNVNGRYLMTLMDQSPNAVVIMDHHYEIVEQKHFDQFNSHELNFIRNGTRALIIRGNKGKASVEDSRKIGFDGECSVAFERFQELDVTNDWEILFDWTSEGHISVSESALTGGAVENRCEGSPWDFLHSNSVDKTDDDHYLLSGRHTDTIYKIDGKTGDIIWRLGGVYSDFPVDGDLKFSRQHDVRFRGQNETHLLLSILDNAKGRDNFDATHKFSRGLLFAVNEKDRTVSIEKSIDHPYTEDRISWRRGNYQVLPNGNIFMGWSEQGVQSEHSSDGTILMEATFAVKWLGTYRQYKFPFVGDPKTPADVVSEAHVRADGSASTIVHVSWNGATEVRTWQLYKTTKNGDANVLLATAAKTGFETMLTADAFAAHVMVAGLDKDGNVLGTSKVHRTKADDVSDEEVAQEKEWEQNIEGSKSGMLRSSFSNPMITFSFGFVCSAFILLVGSYVWRRGGIRMARHTRYYRVGQQDTFEPFTEDGEETSLPLRDGSKERIDER